MRNEHYLAFDEAWFEKHQEKILALSNHWLFKRPLRRALRISGDVAPKTKLKGVWPNRIEFENKIQFRTHKKFSKRMYHAFKPIWWTLHFFDWLFIDEYLPSHSFGFRTLVVRPDASPESTSVDGTVERSVGTIWSSLRGGLGTGANDTATTADCVNLLASSITTQWLRIIRSIFLFDTSALGSDFVVTSATIDLYVNSKVDNFNQGIGVVSSNPASNTALASTDFDIADFGSSAYSVIDITSLSTSAYNTFTLDSAGRLNVSLTAVSKYGLLLSGDINDVAPSWSSSLAATVNSSFADQTGTSEDPFLTIVGTDTKTLTETINTTDTVAGLIAIFKTLTETINATETFIKKTIKSFAETINTTDTTPAKFKVLVQQLAETLGILDSVQRLRNGVLAIWTKTAKTVTAWTKTPK